jgi:hypothetical protein
MIPLLRTLRNTSHLDQIKTRSDLFSVGPRQKEEFLTYINSRLRNKRLEPLVKNLFRPSYGGNRNYTLMYSLGGLMVSSDDDMRPYSLMEDSPESLDNNEISRGRLHKLGKNGYVRKSFDMMSAFFDVLGKPVSEVPENGAIMLDPVRRVERSGTEVHLTPREFDVLRLLMTHSGRPIAHARLLTALRGPDYENDRAYLRVIIGQLRKKLEDDAANPIYILTDSYIGYRFREP